MKLRSSYLLFFKNKNYLKSMLSWMSRSLMTFGWSHCRSAVVSSLAWFPMRAFSIRLTATLVSFQVPSKTPFPRILFLLITNVGETLSCETKKNIFIEIESMYLTFDFFYRCSLVASTCWAAIDDMFRIRRTNKFYGNKFLSVKLGIKFLK
jgi:hypothetical protein